MRYLVAAIRPWNHVAFRRRAPSLPGKWSLIQRREQLTLERIALESPRYVFFPHWSWVVPEEILGSVECVCFHMTDLPYGRGGSPLQNLIARGHNSTMLSALRMTVEMDAGPIYLKRPLSLGGSAQSIYERASELAFDMIEEIARDEPAPRAQSGEPTYFERRLPAQSELPAQAASAQLYDHIRMLDADDYPRAFVEFGEHRIEFGDAILEGGAVSARVTIRPRGEA